MGLEELTKRFPALYEYVKNMPADLQMRYTLRSFPSHHIIHQKDEPLDYFGILCDGSVRVINEFENGNIFMIEKNDPIDFIGEVALLAGYECSSVTIETISPCTILYISRKDCEKWFETDSHFLRLVANRVAYKLYRGTYARGAKLFYPPTFLLLDHLIQYVKENPIPQDEPLIIRKTRQEFQEETGINIKTLNRTIKKLVEDSKLIGLHKGKISITHEQYVRICNEIQSYKD